jgi:hypothetical protein
MTKRVESDDFTFVDPRGNYMRRHLPTRLVLCAAFAGGASLAVVALPGSFAGATTAKTLSCTTLTGGETTQAISGCTGSGVSQTGSKGTSKVVNNVSKKSGKATITWTSTKKTSIESYTYTEDTGTKNTCAAKTGYTKLAMAVEKGTVTGGTATLLKGGAVSGTVCAYSKSGTIYVFNKGPQKL